MSETPIDPVRGQPQDEAEITKVWRDRIKQAEEARQPYEPTWQSNLAFVAGDHDVVWDTFERKLVRDPNLDDVDHYGADIITEFRVTQLGELSADDDRPELLLAPEEPSETEEELQSQINDAVGYGWDHEWQAEDAISEMDRICLDMGFGAIRVRFDPTVGPLKMQVPHYQGKPVFDKDAATKLLENGPRPDVKFKDIREGRTRLDPLTPFNLLTPPGIVHERDFPWEVVVRPRAIDSVLDEYPKAKGLVEDTDIGSVIGLGGQANTTFNPADGANDPSRGKLRGHVWLYTCYERPCSKYPNGRVVILAGEKKRLLEVREELPYKGPDGTYRSGIAYFHWWRLNDRFQSRAFVEGLKDPQRMINRRGTQNVEIIDRAMPATFIDETMLPQKPKGLPWEVVKVKTNGGQLAMPVFYNGSGPGPWMYSDIEKLRADAEHASTLGPAMFGENPANAVTYGQLALLNERENGKRAHILKDRRLSIEYVVECAVHDIRTYWGSEKHILIAGEDNQIQSAVFNASKVPDFYVVRAANGSALPRSQGAELKKIEDVWNAAIACGAAVRDPAWIEWYKNSLNAGEMLDVPEMPSDDQLDKAQLENHVLMQGKHVEVAYYDLPPVHIPEHRSAQIQCEIAGNLVGYQAIEEHVQLHLLVARQNAAEIQQELPAGPLPTDPAAPATPDAPAPPA